MHDVASHIMPESVVCVMNGGALGGWNIQNDACGAAEFLNGQIVKQMHRDLSRSGKESGT